jgi:hypothetical protein
MVDYVKDLQDYEASHVVISGTKELLNFLKWKDNKDKQRVKEAIEEYQQKVLYETKNVGLMDFYYAELLKKLNLGEK